MVKPLKLKFGIQLGKNAIVRLPLRRFKFYIFIKKFKNNNLFIKYYYIFNTNIKQLYD